MATREDSAQIEAGRNAGREVGALAHESDRGAARSAALVTAGILLSRLAGLVRQRVAAHYLGTSATADVVAAAFRLGNLTQNLLGEGTLSASFIPVYARLRGEGKPKEAARFARTALGALLLVTAAVTALGVVGAPWITRILAAGFDAERFDATVRVVRVVFPMTGLLVVAALFLGVLNAHRRFFLPYAAPVLWSLAQIASLVIAGSWLGLHQSALALAVAWGALAGAVLQIAVLAPAVRLLIGGLAPRFDRTDPALVESARRLPGALLGRGVMQISGLVDTLLVSFLGTGAVATLGYAQTLYLLPMSLLGTGEAAAALPDLAENAGTADPARRAALADRLGSSLARVTTLALGATVAFELLGGEMLALLLRTGRFDARAVAEVEPVLRAYGVALLANASSRVLSTACFALGDTKSPARFAAVRVVVSTLVSLALMRPLGVVGVVLGAAVAAWVEAALLARRVHAGLGGLGLARVRLGASLAVSLAAGAAAVGLRLALPPPSRDAVWGAALVLAAFGGAFLAAGRALRVADPRSLLRR